jgi:NAD(P)-dependent dehydrogenase (short-subunit alcohol dehydrogenase family)
MASWMRWPALAATEEQTVSTHQPLTWFITGASQGLGLEIARAALQRGDRVLATTRNPKAALAELGFARDRLCVVPMNLRNNEEIAAAVQTALTQFEGIDVLVNNAGHGLVGAVEEASDEEIRSLFETNVFGLLRMTRAVLPHMRARRSGHVVNISSIAGMTTLPGFGIYSATKFAVEGLSEALALEAAPLGIRVTIVEPGPFRTNFLAGSLAVTDRIIDDYAPTAGATRADCEKRNGRQPGDPVRAAKAIIAAVTAERPPLHLLLGAIAFERAGKKLAALRDEMELWRRVGLATDFPEGGASH